MRELAELVRIEIANALPQGCPSVQYIAQKVNLSSRTMQRRLSLGGSSFSIELDAVRRERAMHLLGGGAISIGALSMVLGYKRQASFSRAVRRWTGSTPRSLGKSSGKFTRKPQHSNPPSGDFSQ